MKKLSVIILFIICSIDMALAANVSGLRMWPAPDHTRLVFDISSPVDYKLFRLENPARLVIDIKDTRLLKKLARPGKTDKVLKNIRSARRSNNDLRVVLDLYGNSRYKSFLLDPNSEYGHRLVVDVQQVSSSKKKIIKKTIKWDSHLRDIVIAIDAGHGGEDPGARGHKGTFEKNVVFQIARQLAAMVEKERGLKPVMVRNGDYFISLRNRTLIARKNQADLFVSIHADSFKDRRVKGTSVYVLSQNGATSEAARWLAEKENASDLIGGVSLDDKDNLLASVLLDLSQTATIEASYEAGTEILGELRPLGKLHKHRVQQAGFAVLKSPDIPSILVETAFISNPSEERKLRNKQHQKKVARAILGGIKGYFAKYAPPGTLYAARKHIIARGDTLSEIAQRYNVTIASIRDFNKLNSNKVRIGQVLRIPSGSDS
ncbi:MAG: N-acetylmuramoyl-L-alanine amidase [Gammaproteobacteria bacterium]